MPADDSSTTESDSSREPMSLQRRRLLALAGVSLAAGLSGCGGDDTQTTDPDTPGDGTNSPGDDTDAPGDGTATPAADTDTPGDDTTTPGDGTDTPDMETPVRPLPEDPPSLLELEGIVVSPGTSTTLSGRVVNPFVHPVQSVVVSLEAPADWSLTATGQTAFDSIADQSAEQTSWTLSAPEGASGQVTLEGTVSYETTTDSAEVAVSVPVSVSDGDLDAGLAAHWSFDSGTVSDGTVSDQSGNDNDGTFVGDPTVDSGIVSDGLALDGDDWVQVDHSDSLQVQTGDFTLVAWVNPGATTSQMGVISKKTDDGVGDAELAYQVNLGGYTAAGGSSETLAPTFVYSDGSGPLASAVDQALSTGTWHHLAVSYDHDNTTIEWFVDGSSVETDTLSGMPTTNEQELFLGSHFASGGTPSSALDGVLDDVRIYTEAKSEAFIGGLYALGNPG